MFNALRHTLFTILLLTASTAYGEVKAVINGPTKIEFGSLLVLSAAESIGDNHDWIVDPKFATPVRIDKQAKELWSGLPGPGVFNFILVVTDKQAEIAFTQWTVEVTLPSWLGPPKPPIISPVDPPIQPPVIDTGLKTETEKLIKQLNDKDTTSKLIYQFDILINSSEELTPVKLQQAIDTVLINRTGESDKKPWIDGWRKPIDSLIAKNIQNGISLKICVQQILEGLRQALPSLSSVSLKPNLPFAEIVYENTPGCPPCIKFSNEVKPLIVKEGHKFVREATTNNRRAYPYFEIKVGDKTFIHTGELTLSAFHSLVGR
jgi:hypothetical protein